MLKSSVSQDSTRSETDYAISEAGAWFAEHVTLDGKPYTLDEDQVRAAIDDHKNTLVTARAGSGKTRVIVAKVAYLVAKQRVPLDEIAIFMFNRTAAAEVNERTAKIQIDGRGLVDEPVLHVASTFHKYALNIVKQAGERPKIISESEHDQFIREALEKSLKTHKRRISPNEKRELLNIVSGFVTRAGQKFPGRSGLNELTSEIQNFCKTSTDPKLRFYHEVSYRAYTEYLAQLQSSLIDFNLLMSRATEVLNNSKNPAIFQKIRRLKYLMIDEYQDFSYLFFALTTAIRKLAPNAKLFAVGDDWQAINRFAGSDVDYFLNFSTYFPEDNTNIPLATNYRSARKIVERANHYMLNNYNPKALPARAFSHKHGKITIINPTKIHFDTTDILEDGNADGRYQIALAHAAKVPIKQISISAAKLLKQLVRLIKRHRHSDIMLLHRHNFTSYENVDLETLRQALKVLIVSEHIMTGTNFEQQIRCMTMHKSKGLESEIVILLEVDREVVAAHHPHATIFPLFGDTRTAESADQKRLLYVAMTRAKQRLYILSQERTSLI